jgi:hypothetical protein
MKNSPSSNDVSKQSDVANIEPLYLALINLALLNLTLLRSAIVNLVFD